MEAVTLKNQAAYLCRSNKVDKMYCLIPFALNMQHAQMSGILNVL